MTHFATITGPVTYTPGDGAPLTIPKGRVEITLDPDSATLSWEAAPDVVGLAAIPRIQFDLYVKEGQISAPTETKVDAA